MFTTLNPTRDQLAREHVERRDVWCSANLCNHPYDITAPKETAMPRTSTRVRLTDTIIGGSSTIELHNLRDFLLQWLPEPTDEMIGVMDDLCEKLAQGGQNVDPECACLGIKVEVL